MSATPAELQGLRVLVVEDNFLVAEAVREVFEDRGCIVVGPVSRLAEALVMSERADLDGAVLDINLAGEFCFPLAEALRECGVPFIFLTGYAEASLIPPEFRDVPRLAKPFDALEVAEVAAARFGGS